MNNNTKNIIKIGFPLLASQMSHYLMNVADKAMVGHLGMEQLAAISMASLFFYVTAVMVWPISIGSQAITSRRFGRLNDAAENEKEKLYSFTGQVMDNGIITGAVLGVIGIFIYQCAPFVLSKLITDKALIPYSLSYLSIMRWVLPIIGISSAFTGFLGGIRKTQIIMIATLIPNLLNILLNYIFIYGKLGVSPMGITGAALGTVIANGFAPIMLIIYILRSKSIRKYQVFHFKKLDITMIKRIINFSYPAAVQNGGAFAIFLFYQSMVGGIGTMFLASTSIVFSLYRINKTIVGGFARGASILVGNALGMNDHSKAKEIIISMEKIALVVGLVILVTILLFPAAIVSIFTNDAQTITTGIKALRFFAFFFFAEVMGFSLEIIFQNIGWAKYVLFSEATTNILFILTMTWVSTELLGLGIYAAWLSFGLYQLFHAIILIVGYFSGKWEKIEIEN
ncbi:MAG: MATE family efflux transporter [Spirochaetaceae bacterium]|jgi:MATE family multidrug resistance protein|nr:MATE family efflux transporter [Spirochaetaceae bacterium]